VREHSCFSFTIFDSSKCNLLWGSGVSSWFCSFSALKFDSPLLASMNRLALCEPLLFQIVRFLLDSVFDLLPSILPFSVKWLDIYSSQYIFHRLQREYLRTSLRLWWWMNIAHQISSLFVDGDFEASLIWYCISAIASIAAR
jgi:hypothetical protein